MKSIREIEEIHNLDEMTCVISNEFEDIANKFIFVGFLLKRTRDTEMYKQKGYKDISEYAKATWGISRSVTERYMKLNDKYSIGGNSPQIEDKYRGYGSSKLTDMLQLPEDIQEAVTKEATVRDVRDAKKIIEETKDKYSDQMELCDITQEEPEEAEWLKELILHLFKNDCKNKFKEFIIWLKSPDGRSPLGIEEDVLGFINPTKFKMVRLERANIMLQAEKICVMPYRNQGERKEYTYIEFARTFESVFFPDGMDGSNAETAYEKVFEELLYPKAEEHPTKKAETPKKPENTTSEQKTEEQKPAEPKPEAKTTEKPENTKHGAKSGDNRETEVKTEPEITKKPENTISKTDSIEELPGQMDIENDFPEYCPAEQTVEADPEEPETAAGHPYKTRAEYLQTLSVEEYAQYMAEAMRMQFVGLTFRQLTEKELWKSWLTCFVDESGRTIEEG